MCSLENCGSCSALLFSDCIRPCLLRSLSSAMDQKTDDKVAIKKLYRPFQSLIHTKRAYRELRLLRHIQHENVSAAWTACPVTPCCEGIREN